MMAELLGRVDGLNRGRGGSMHVADLGLGIYGANGIVAAGAPFAAGAAWSFRSDGTDRVAVTFFGDGGVEPGRAARDDEPRRALAAAARLRLREQRLRRHAPAGARRPPARSSPAPRPTAWPPSRSTAWTSRRCSTRRERAVAPGARGRRADVPRVPDLPLLRAPHGRAHDEARLPHRRGDRALARARPGADRRRGARRRPSASASTPRSRRCSTRPSRSPARARSPTRPTRSTIVYASGLRAAGGGRRMTALSLPPGARQGARATRWRATRACS